MTFEILGKTCATEREYEMRLVRFRDWVQAHPFAYRNRNISVPACITYVFADRYKPGEAEMMRLLGHTRTDMSAQEIAVDRMADGTRVMARRVWNERAYPSKALTRDEYLANPVGCNA
jgi:hypothetical protein